MIKDLGENGFHYDIGAIKKDYNVSKGGRVFELQRPYDYNNDSIRKALLNLKNSKGFETSLIRGMRVHWADIRNTNIGQDPWDEFNR